MVFTCRTLGSNNARLLITKIVPKVPVSSGVDSSPGLGGGPRKKKMEIKKKRERNKV